MKQQQRKATIILIAFIMLCTSLLFTKSISNIYADNYISRNIGVGGAPYTLDKLCSYVTLTAYCRFKTNCSTTLFGQKPDGTRTVLTSVATSYVGDNDSGQTKTINYYFTESDYKTYTKILAITQETYPFQSSIGGQYSGSATLYKLEHTSHVASEPVRENETAATDEESAYYEEVVYCSVCGQEISRNKIYTGENVAGDVNEPSDEENEYNEATVTADIPSDYKIIIPKTITISGATKEGTYYVRVIGDMSDDEKIIVTPDSSVVLSTESNVLNKKASQLGIITQDKTEWIWNNVDEDAIGNISAPGLTAGKWSGKFNFIINYEKIKE